MGSQWNLNPSIKGDQLLIKELSSIISNKILTTLCLLKKDFRFNLKKYHCSLIIKILLCQHCLYHLFLLTWR